MPPLPAGETRMMEGFTVEDLSRRCEEESARYLRHETYTDRFCFELFRRAIVERNDVAWAAVYDRYSEMVRRWLDSLPDAADVGIAGAFERFWRAITPAKFERFESLSAILQYLKMCVHTAELDRRRAQRKTAREQPFTEGYDLLAHDNPEETATHAVDARVFWAHVQRLLDDRKELRVVYLSYVIGLTPRAICERHGDAFPDIQEVYRLKRTALDRLKRAPELQTLL
jgi:DNA-directed RNA polymerase specialized sigma24 family protein